MVRTPVLFALDAGLAALTVLAHPALLLQFKVVLAAYAAFCILLPRPALRFMLPVIDQVSVCES